MDEESESGVLGSVTDFFHKFIVIAFVYYLHLYLMLSMTKLRHDRSLAPYLEASQWGKNLRFMSYFPAV